MNLRLQSFTILIVCVIIQSNAGYSQLSKNITEDEIYDFMNSVIFGDGQKIKINPGVLINKYDSVYCEDQDSNAVYGIDCLMKDFSFYTDTLSHFIDSADIAFFKEQIKRNQLFEWDKDKLPENVKFGRKNSRLWARYSFPLFSTDRKTVILASVGPLRFIAYHWNEKTKKWDFIDIVQYGT